MSYDDIAAAQGWNDETLRMLMERFIEEQCLAGAFEDYLERVAREENAEFAASFPEHDAPVDESAAGEG